MFLYFGYCEIAIIPVLTTVHRGSFQRCNLRYPGLLANMPGEQIMSSNLPLLFSKGQPRSLETIVQDELEEFVRFMFLCSLKLELDINIPVDLNQLPRPQWWPEEIPFRFPICENGSSDEKQVVLKQLVCRCYTFYDCEYYLKFSSELADKPISFLKYEQNPQEHTTTILDADGNVLVKCRNENFTYDKPKTQRKKMLHTPGMSSTSVYDKRKTRSSNMLPTPEIPSTAVPPLQTTQPKIIIPLIDLTFESSGDESEVSFKEKTLLPTTVTSEAPLEHAPLKRAPLERAPLDLSRLMSLRRRKLPREETAVTSKIVTSSRTTRKLIGNLNKENKDKNLTSSRTARKLNTKESCIGNLNKENKEKNRKSKETAGTSKIVTSSRTTRKLIGNLNKENKDKNENSKETAGTSKIVTSSRTARKLLIENFNKENKAKNGSSKETAGTSKIVTSSRTARKLFIGNLNKENKEKNENSKVTAGTSKTVASSRTSRKLLIENINKDNKEKNANSKEIAGTSKIGATSSIVTRKKLLIENLKNEDKKQNENSKKIRSQESSKKRKRNIQLPMTKKRRLFEDFPREEVEPEVLNKDQFMSRLNLAPRKEETLNLSPKNEGRKRILQCFSWVVLSHKGQPFLAKNDKKFNMEASLDRNNKHCGTHHSEEQNYICTRSNNISSTLSKKALIPENSSAFLEGDVHKYIWPHRGRNVVYPQKGPSVKQCSVELTLLSEETIHLWSTKKCTIGTMTPREWRDSASTCLDCQNIPLITLDIDPNLKVKNESTSTRCICTTPKPQLKSKAKIVTNAQAIIPPEPATMSHHKQDSDNLPFGMISMSSTVASPEQINLEFLSDKDGFHGFPTIQSEGLPSYTKRMLNRRPLAVVAPEPSTINEEIVDVTCISDHSSPSSSIKLHNLFRSLTDAIKWYTKDEPSDCLADSLVKEGLLFATEGSQENTKPFTELMVPSSKRPIDYFKIGVDLSKRDYCFERSSNRSSKVVTRRGERHYLNREPCPSCFQGKDSFCIYEFIRQAKHAGVTLYKNTKQLKMLFFRFVQALNSKE